LLQIIIIRQSTLRPKAMGSQAQDHAQAQNGHPRTDLITNKTSGREEKDESLTIEPAQSHDTYLNEKTSYTPIESPNRQVKQSKKAPTPIGKAHGESILPGWTIMRPLRMKAMGRAKKPAEGTDGVVSQRSSKSEERDGENKGLKGVTTNGTASSAGDLEGLTEMRSDDELLDDSEDRMPGGGHGTQDPVTTTNAIAYKVYKRRWFGLVQLVLLNIIVSWDVSQL
jgi:hypothetical protein